MPILNDAEREFVAVGAAVAAGCRPCTQYHVRAARKAGLGDEDIRSSVERAELLRIEAAKGTADFARGLLGAEPEQRSPASPAGDRATALVRLGAAGGGNAGYLLGDLMAEGRRSGVTDEALREAVQIASAVKTAAANFFDRDVERVLGSVADASPSEAACCASPGAACGDEPAPVTGGSCC